MKDSLKRLQSLVKDLPEDKKEEVVDFAEYLHFQQVERRGVTQQILEGLKQVKEKKFRPAKDLLPHDL